MTKRRKKSDYTKLVLQVVGAVGLVAVAVIAPNVLQVFGKNALSGKRRSKKSHYINEKIKTLVSRGLLVSSLENGKRMVRLTKKGEIELEKYRLKEKVLKRRKWDNNWRILIFDIKEKRRRTRDLLRAELDSFGFKQLQKSVWVTPYRCEDIITLLKADLRVGKDILVIEANYIENDKMLRKQFNL